jgi:hypothetical protein
VEKGVDAFAYGDLLDAVQYQLGFEPDARNEVRLTSACTALLRVEPPKGDLGDAASPIIRYCKGGDESVADQAADAYVQYRETMFAQAH